MEVQGRSQTNPTLNLSVESAPVVYTIESPTTLHFVVNNTSLFGGSTAVFQIYNLSPEKRNDIYRDVYDIGVYRYVQFRAGYSNEPNLPLVFKGNIMTAYSFRQGTDWITEIEAFDGLYGKQYGFVNFTLSKGATVEFMIAQLCKTMPKINVGSIGDFSDAVGGPLRGVTISGNAWELLCRRLLTLDATAFIDKESVNVLRNWEYLSKAEGIPEISAETGLLDTPQRRETEVKARMMFEPRINLWQKIQLKTLASNLAGEYIVKQVSHTGTISGAECGPLSTIVTLLQPNRVAAPV